MDPIISKTKIQAAAPAKEIKEKIYPTDIRPLKEEEIKREEPLPVNEQEIFIKDLEEVLRDGVRSDLFVEKIVMNYGVNKQEIILLMGKYNQGLGAKEEILKSYYPKLKNIFKDFNI